jgi:hypothetical protein
MFGFFLIICAIVLLVEDHPILAVLLVVGACNH